MKRAVECPMGVDSPTWMSPGASSHPKSSIAAPFPLDPGSAFASAPRPSPTSSSVALCESAVSLSERGGVHEMSHSVCASTSAILPPERASGALSVKDGVPPAPAPRRFMLGVEYTNTGGAARSAPPSALDLTPHTPESIPACPASPGLPARAALPCTTA